MPGRSRNCRSRISRCIHLDRACQPYQPYSLAGLHIVNVPVDKNNADLVYRHHIQLLGLHSLDADDDLVLLLLYDIRSEHWVLVANALQLCEHVEDVSVESYNVEYHSVVDTAKAFTSELDVVADGEDKLVLVLGRSVRKFPNVSSLNLMIALCELHAKWFRFRVKLLLSQCRAADRESWITLTS